MTLFSYLLVGHLIGDYLLQTRWMAERKAAEWLPLLAHCLVYTIVIIGAFLIGSGSFSWIAAAFIFASHVFLDRRTFVAWWARNVMGTAGGKPAWLLIMADQVFHVIVLAVIAHFWS
ncbi:MULTISPECIES: DUF3307 domain-containing protein [Sporosarcina]|uniref:DUF3307 domain-containing protein n=1 Tax=Sporosarcina TaxID=1569 RepID=UPI00058B4DC5|nr:MULTISPECIES: DUF3307 domain-containing protein [Sporosarcina]WJY28384.1 DUF3307 domain-containing protein [Sporosarcina sp. 0.2-SM1T-5]